MKIDGELHLADLFPIIEEKLKSGGEVTINPGGISMLPLIKKGRDSVVLKKAPEKLKKYDVVLYRRKSGQFVLHRVVGEKDGAYVMCGDNEFMHEPGIERGAVLAIMSAVIRNKKYVSADNFFYRMYSVIWVFLQSVHGKIRRTIRKIRRKYKNLG